MSDEQQERKMFKVKLTDQAIGAVMMAVQIAMKKQEDVNDMIRGFDLTVGELQNGQEGLVVLNPPVAKFNEVFEMGPDEEELENTDQEE